MATAKKSPGRSRPGAGATTIDEYLAAVEPAQRAALQRLREQIRAAAPEAEECISYQLPAFRQDGLLVSFAAMPKHCSFFLMSTETLPAHRDELAGYEASGGTIRFQPDRPLPAAHVKKLVRTRLAENAAARAKREKAKAARR